MNTDIILTEGETITIERKVTVSGKVVLRPYEERGFNCGGCRKRHHTIKHVFQGEYQRYNGQYHTTMIYPHIVCCGKEECFNILLLKHAERLSHYRNISMLALPQHRANVTCHKCGKKGYGWRNERRTLPYYRAWHIENNNNLKGHTYCSVDCFIMDNTTLK